MSTDRLPYKTYAEYLAERFPGQGKIQKIGVSIGLSCPNRDGTIGRGGCTYCNNASFSPDYIAGGAEITATLHRGIDFFCRKYPTMRYLAYFQSYTNTHGASEDSLIRMYTEAAGVQGVIGIIIGTRPDCVADSLLDSLAAMNRDICPVSLEFGAETSHDATLRRVNRGHTWADTVSAVHRASQRGLSVGLHFIMGLPGETRRMMLDTVSSAVELPIDTVKFHQLQIIRHTPMADEYAAFPEHFDLFTPQSYADLCRDIIEIVNAAPRPIAIERFVSQAPENLLIAPRWGLKNYQFTALLQK